MGAGGEGVCVEWWEVRTTTDYRLRKPDGALCPDCSKPIHLLASNQLKDRPAFYICFDCKWVGHIGVGPVTKRRGGGK